MGTGNNQTEVPTQTGTAPLIATDFFTFGCSNQAAGLRDLWGGQRVLSSYLEEFFGMDGRLDFLNGRVFANKKSYLELLKGRLGNPESITGTFTFNFTGSAEVYWYNDSLSGDTCRRFHLDYSDTSDTNHRYNVYSNGQNMDYVVTNCKLSSLSLHLAVGDGDLNYWAAVKASADFHLMWVFTPAVPSSL